MYTYQTANYGDYAYQAGGIFGTLGGIIGGVAGIASKVLPGPFGAVAGVVSKTLKPSATTTTLAQPQRFIPPPTGVMQGPQARTPLLGLPVSGAGIECPSGFHKNKSDYFLKSGEFVPAGSRCVRNRKLNPGNARSVRRATRRAEAFIGLAKRVARETPYKVVSKSYRSNWRKPLKR